jgi:hypothetical protein
MKVPLQGKCAMSNTVCAKALMGTVLTRQTVFVANTKHQFQQSVGRKDATRICSICQKKFKSALILQCQRCGLLCDHKCAKYSIKQVKCLRSVCIVYSYTTSSK